MTIAPIQYVRTFERSVDLSSEDRDELTRLFGVCQDDAARQFVPLACTPEMRNRCREIASVKRDDYDRAVLIILDDFDRLMYGTGR